LAKILVGEQVVEKKPVVHGAQLEDQLLLSGFGG